MSSVRTIVLSVQFRNFATKQNHKPLHLLNKIQIGR